MSTTGLYIALVCAIAAIVYGVISINWILAKPAGNAPACPEQPANFHPHQ